MQKQPFSDSSAVYEDTAELATILDLQTIGRSINRDALARNTTVVQCQMVAVLRPTPDEKWQLVDRNNPIRLTRNGELKMCSIRHGFLRDRDFTTSISYRSGYTGFIGEDERIGVTLCKIFVLPPSFALPVNNSLSRLAGKRHKLTEEVEQETVGSVTEVLESRGGAQL